MFGAGPDPERRSRISGTASTRSYWLDLFSWGTWNEFLKSGANVSGFRLPRLNQVEQMKVGDYLLCYLTGISRFIGILEVTSEAFTDNTPIWNSEAFPARVNVKLVAQLDAETAVPVADLLTGFSWFSKLKTPEAWGGVLPRFTDEVGLRRRALGQRSDPQRG